MGYDYIFKIVLAGDQSVGKSNLLLRATKDQFDSDSQVTLGIEFSSKFFKIPDEPSAKGTNKKGAPPSSTYVKA